MLNRSAATTARDSLQNAVDDHDKCLAEAVKRSQDLFTLRQESSHGLIADVEAYVNSLANTREADHVDPWHAGGKSILSNCRMLCKPCNRRKGGV